MANKRNMQPHKTQMPEQKPEIRNSNFAEVAWGYTAEMAVNEAKRCLECKKRPCVEGCPVGVEIPDFVAAIAKEDFQAAYDIIIRTNALPAVCGRVCPQETQCESKCVRGIKNEPVAIGRLERFAADYAMSTEQKGREKAASNGRKVAMIGAGPASLTCAGELAELGYEVTIFEAFHRPGGVLIYGIPEFRLPKEIVAKEIEGLEKRGVKIETNVVVGRSILVNELFDKENFEAVFVATGAGLPTFMNLSGENLNGVYSANEFLTRINLMKAYDDAYDTPVVKAKSVAVIGGGNVAMDAARCAKRLGADVRIVYRRSMEEMPARNEEIHHAMEEGIEFHLLTAPTEILGNDEGWITGLACRRMKLGEPDESGRRKPVEIQGSEFVIDTDCMIVAIGNTSNPIIMNTTPGLDVNKWGNIVADEKSGATSLPGVFAGGDIVTGAATVILAMGAGKAAAAGIDKFIKEKHN
ncbi:MAG: NADPH-dependent glutamate synthase [Syntrophomonadaceae bacterium]|jgi:glutamate synthase (NADPH/NADH) small chain|nr:NADPH-dependent glutamate synthase [Syntrophomonadaceae bacterium]